MTPADPRSSAPPDERTATTMQQQHDEGWTKKDQPQEPGPTRSAPAARCDGTVVGDGPWYRSSRCTRKAKVVRDGKAYCGQHDPEAKRARQAKRTATWNAAWEMKKARGALDAAVRAAGNALADYTGDDIPDRLAHARAAILDARDALRATDPDSTSVVLAVDRSRSTPQTDGAT